MRFTWEVLHRIKGIQSRHVTAEVTIEGEQVRVDLPGVGTLFFRHKGLIAPTKPTKKRRLTPKSNT